MHLQKLAGALVTKEGGISDPASPKAWGIFTIFWGDPIRLGGGASVL